MIDKKDMTRRDFLKIIASFVAGVAALRYQQLLKLTQPKGKTALKEARFYKVADDLAG